MSGGAILDAAGELIAAGIRPDVLPGVLEARLRLQHEDHLAAVIAGDETLDLSRLATLVAAEGIDLADADHLVLRDADDAIADAEHRLAHPARDDDPRWITGELARLVAVRERRERKWSDKLGAADFALDATITYASAAPAERVLRPTATLDEAVHVVEAAIADAVEGRGPAHVLIVADRGTSKTHTAVRLVALMATARRRWIQDHRRDHPGTTYADAANVADAAGMRPFRVLYVAETHDLVGATVKLARETFGMTAEHHGGYKAGTNELASWYV